MTHKAQIAIVLVPLHVADHAGGQVRATGSCCLRRGVEQVQAADAVFVGDEGDPLAVEADSRALSTSQGMSLGQIRVSAWLQDRRTPAA